MRHLPQPFTWQDYLDWVEAEYPDVTYDKACNTFEAIKRLGMVREAGVRDDGEVLYEKGIRPNQFVVLVKKKEKS